MTFVESSGKFSLTQSIEQTKLKFERVRPGFVAEEDGGFSEFLARAKKSYSSQSRRRLVLDVTGILQVKSLTGIQRVILSLARCFKSSMNEGGIRVAFAAFDGRIFREVQLVDANANVSDANANVAPFGFLVLNTSFVFLHGDSLILAEPKLRGVEEFFVTIARLRRAGLRIVSVVHDLQPILDAAAFGNAISAAFLVWWSQTLRHSDMMVTVSRKVARDIACYVSVTSMLGLTPTRKLPVAYFRLGCDALVSKGEGTPNSELPVDLETFYTVGNLFAYKGQFAVMTAMESLWAEGIKAKLVLVGMDLFRQAERMSLRAHPAFGALLFMPGYLPDAELAHALSRCGALIAASRYEGFGLPLVEAAALGCPVIARDIEIFQETSGGMAYFFADGGPEDIANCLRGWFKLTREQQLGYVPKESLITWRESARMLQAIILEEASSFSMDVGVEATLNLATSAEI